MSGCIEWTGYRLKQGYGHRKVAGRMQLVHRLAWEEAHGPVPNGLCVLHRCDNPPCFNVDHLFLGTRADNNADMRTKGRARSGRVHGEQHGMARLTAEQVAEVRQRHRSGEQQTEIAASLNVSKSTIWMIVHNRTWRI